MTINEYGIYDITPIISIIANVIIVLKTIDYVIFRNLKTDRW